MFHFIEFVINISNKINFNIKAFILYFEKGLIFTSTFYFHKRKFGMLNVHYPISLGFFGRISGKQLLFDVCYWFPRYIHVQHTKFRSLRLSLAKN